MLNISALYHVADHKQTIRLSCVLTHVSEVGCDASFCQTAD